jgi:transposase
LQVEEITLEHCFVHAKIMAHIEELEARRDRFDLELLHSLQVTSYSGSLQPLQTLHRIDLMGSAMLLVEIRAEMSVFGNT